ncbi:MAG: ATP-binding protein [Collinsella sp.]|nr:ATP-binding protein [Collinsella sp.]
MLDEQGYVPLDIEGARLLFQVMSVPEGRQSMIVTANIEFSKWVTVFGDDKMAAAVVDRLVYTGRLVEFNGASCRIESRVLCCLLALPGH